MAGKGGARPGAGRKSKTEEEKVKRMAIKAITTKYKSLNKGLVALLNSGEPSLMKFVFEHAIGKPKDTVKLEDGGLFKIMNVDPLSEKNG